MSNVKKEVILLVFVMIFTMVYLKGHISWNKGLTKGIDRRLNFYKNGKEYHLFGKKHSQETINKIKKAWREGKYSNIPPPSLETKVKISISRQKFFEKGGSVWIKGKKHSSKTKEKISKSMMNHLVSEKTKKIMSEQQLGHKHPNWKGGITPLRTKIWKSQNYVEWRNSVFKRDNFTCQLCYNNRCNLHSHHIKKFNKYPLLRFDVNNGITLCIPCHAKIRCKEEKLIEYFIHKLERKC